MSIFAEYAKVRTIISGAVLEVMEVATGEMGLVDMNTPEIRAKIARNVIQKLSDSGYAIEERPKQ